MKNLAQQEEEADRRRRTCTPQEGIGAARRKVIVQHGQDAHGGGGDGLAAHGAVEEENAEGQALLRGVVRRSVLQQQQGRWKRPSGQQKDASPKKPLKYTPTIVIFIVIIMSSLVTVFGTFFSTVWCQCSKVWSRVAIVTPNIEPK